MNKFAIGVYFMLLTASLSLSQDGEGSGDVCLGGFKGEACDIPYCIANSTSVWSNHNCSDGMFLTGFSASDIGVVVGGDLTCDQNCSSPYGSLPTATRACILDNGTAYWQDPVAINCTIGNLSLISDELERAEFMVALTSSASVTTTVINEVITELGKFVVADNSQIAVTLLQTINNLIVLAGSNNNDLATTITSRSEELTDVVDSKVLLNSNFTSYSEMLSNVAIANFISGTNSVSFGTDRTDSMAWFETGTSNNSWLNSAHITATSRAVGDFGFKAYSNCLLHGNQCDRTGITSSSIEPFFNSIIIGALIPPNTQLDLTFELFLNEAEFQDVACMIWDGTQWKVSGCHITNSDLASIKSSVTFQCTGSGDYIVQTKYLQEVVVLPGLTDAEIAGIAVGAAAGVALIAGGGYYGYSQSKKKKKNKVKTIEPIEGTHEMTPVD